MNFKTFLKKAINEHNSNYDYISGLKIKSVNKIFYRETITCYNNCIMVKYEVECTLTGKNNETVYYQINLYSDDGQINENNLSIFYDGNVKPVF